MWPCEVQATLEQRFGTIAKGTEEFGPDLSWHVIRMLHQGVNFYDLLSPEEYQHLDKKQVTVTQGHVRDRASERG